MDDRTPKGIQPELPDRIRIRLADGKRLVVPGERLRHLAVTQAHLARPLDGGHICAHHFTITHTRTGLKVAGIFPSYRSARKAAEKLEALPIPWDTLTARSGPKYWKTATAKLRASVLRIRKAAGAEEYVHDECCRTANA